MSDSLKKFWLKKSKNFSLGQFTPLSLVGSHSLILLSCLFLGIPSCNKIKKKAKEREKEFNNFFKRGIARSREGPCDKHEKVYNASKKEKKQRVPTCGFWIVCKGTPFRKQLEYETSSREDQIEQLENKLKVYCI